VTPSPRRSNDGGRLCDAVDRPGDLLVRFGAETGLPVVTPALRRLIDTARARVPSRSRPARRRRLRHRDRAERARVAAAVRAAWRDAGILPLDVVAAAQEPRPRSDPRSHPMTARSPSGSGRT
jgi:hypothetical protein